MLNRDWGYQPGALCVRLQCSDGLELIGGRRHRILSFITATLGGQTASEQGMYICSPHRSATHMANSPLPVLGAPMYVDSRRAHSNCQRPTYKTLIYDIGQISKESKEVFSALCE